MAISRIKFEKLKNSSLQDYKKIPIKTNLFAKGYRTYNSSEYKAVAKTFRSTFKQRQAPSSSKVLFVSDRFRYQVFLYFAVRGKITLVKRATQRLSSVEECCQVKLLEPLTVGQMGISYPNCASLGVLHIVPQR